ncbi:metal ABC transporter solute-binding protein, Zn/Mn family [Fundicoccus sp. Sow4_D5]|uniref:metal ABC transporter solute-binding protein, Zn/Mn family n=1 Tax=Fundicoccus sp. Sow4_D5 TaxID=3438782 RepID=UPI003F8DC990
MFIKTKFLFIRPIIVLLLLFTCALRSTTLPIKAQEESLLKVTVTTSFLEDIVRRIAEDTVDISLIIPAGGDPHLYNASARDLPKILEADLLLYHGLNFEAQMATALEDYGFSVTDNFPKEQLIFVAEDSNEIDPHYWFNLDLYKQSVIAARDHLMNTFPEHADLYTRNTAEYISELDALGEWIDEQIALLAVDERILVTPHDAFEYFAQMNNFTVYAPQGISTEAEVSNEAIIQTVEFIIEHQIPAIFLDTTSNPQAMEKLQEGVSQLGGEVIVVGGEDNALYSDSLAASGQANDNYIDMYKHNVSLIVKHLTK